MPVNKPNYIFNESESSSSKEENYAYKPNVANSVTLSTISQSSQKDLPKIGDEPRFASMSMHKIFVNSQNYEERQPGRGGEYACSKLKYLVPRLPSYLVSPFPK